MYINFTVPGKPQGKARARTVRNGGSVHSFTPEKTLLYENLVKQRCIEAKGDQYEESGPVDVEIYAYFEMPASASKKKQAKMLCGEILPTKKPDADNIAKCICDALNGIAYKDDAQIVNLLVFKRYAKPGEPPYVSVLIESH